ncbi:MAG: alkylhalidase [Pirellulaceae bacterium]|nr:MAG: alkylhalidase [Pirellulaceae bacterium]
MAAIDRYYPVVVIGGGPAGSAAASILAQHGVKCAVFERERFPRFHIGESLIPDTYFTLKRMKLIPALQRSHFVKKYSVQFVADDGRLSAPFYFMQHRPHESSQTWQVLRSEFDQLLLYSAAEQGAQVHEGCRVSDVLFEGSRAVGIRVTGCDGKVHEVRADVVIDATGQSSLLMHKLQLKVPDPVLHKGAIWTYYQGAYRDQGQDAGATVVLQVEGKKGWFWYIPLHHDVVSVGITADFEYLFSGRGVDHGKIFEEELQRCPAVRDRLASGRRITRHFATRDFSYRSRQAAGDGWLLVGDALGFLDPLYSSGVLLALKSGELAADAVAEAILSGDTRSDRLGKMGSGFRARHAADAPPGMRIL